MESLPPVDIIYGGSSCQDRSGLFMEQTRITKEMRDAEEGRGAASLRGSPFLLGMGILEDGFERRLLAMRPWHIATAVVFPQKSESTWQHL